MSKTLLKCTQQLSKFRSDLMNIVENSNNIE